MTALTLGVHPSRCTSEVHGGTCEMTRENSLASWSAVASPRDTAFRTLLQVCFTNHARKRCRLPLSGLQTPVPSIYPPIHKLPQRSLANSGSPSKICANPNIVTVFAFSMEIELSPTFPIDGGTVTPKKRRRRIQKPQCFEWFPPRKLPKKRTVLFDAKKITKNPKKSRKKPKKFTKFRLL